MGKTYKGNLTLEWYNKQKSIMIQGDDMVTGKDIQAPIMNWVNKDSALFYEIIDSEGRGLKPYWVDQNDIRVKETRPLIFKRSFSAKKTDKPGTLSGTDTIWEIDESQKDDNKIDNILIRGDNLLVLNSLKKVFSNKPEEEKIKCAYLDVPYNTGSAFEYYDDNLNHSEWLTLIRDRFAIIRSLMRKDGFIFVQIDNKEAFRLKILMDEIFGEDNFVNDIIWKRRGGSANPSNRLNNVTDYILWYSMTPGMEFNQIFSLNDENTKKYIEERFNNIDEKGRRFMKSPLQSPNPRPTLVYEYKGYKCPKNGWSISKEIMVKWDKEGKLWFPPNKTQNINRKIYLDEYKGQPISNLWTDIKVINPMSKERTDFDGGQKPEALIERILTFSTNEGDYVLDAFGGTGTTFSTAHKMKRKWIGIELGEHAEKFIIPRMINVLNGTDTSGISKNINWQGGGSFKYLQLGSSIIKIGKDHNVDFNWELERKNIEESFLISYDYNMILNNYSDNKKLFINDESKYTLGIQTINNKSRIAIISLNPPNEKNEMISFNEIINLYKELKKQYSPEYINIFTNRGVELASDSKPDDLEIIKIPQAIFSELEK